ncbi:MAG: bifunctional glutamate N-acetyltransferase/amino-acid acetyltransferase ArgJ [Desulfopila sp.]|jgi:glutamate N-acetyltransferase/amino-acid N-acetyltransferase|nr:bifunctional glutamate N-acetyltransferase/amino-acid acetyltransferase ArgJ [Desulfopila sp.]
MRIEGFSTAAVAAGIKYPDRLDLGLIFSDEPVVTAGVFTTNQVIAAPLVLDMERLKQGRAQAILVNSGCANACTGKQGMDTCIETGRMVAQALNIKEEMVQLSSTGVIGEQLNMAVFKEAIPRLIEGLGPDNFEDVAEAIMTTDTVKKTVYRTVDIGGKKVSFMAMAKGSGMIMPDMATMLGFVLTDAQIGFVELNSALQSGVAESFNRITVDGDTSTNDMVLIMANGKAANPWIEDRSSDEYLLFAESLASILKELALMIVADGEGATKTITIRVTGAKEKEEALQIGRTIANSNLVKTAFFGEDANWGRIFAAMGRSGVKFNPQRVDILFDDIMIVKGGLALGKEAEARADTILKKRDICVTVDLKEGSACEEVYTCDFSVDYVRINADYRS